MISQTLKLAAILAFSGLSSLVSADCDLHNTLTEPMTEPETRTALCQTMNPDSWTFALDVSMVSVPTFDGDNPLAGVAGNTAFIVYDNDCIPIGIYSPDEEGNDCGVPYWINDIGLPYDIAISQVNLDVGDPSFTINYANGAYMIGENGATCQDISDGLYAEQACHAAFPINGEPDAGNNSIIRLSTRLEAPIRGARVDPKRLLSVTAVTIDEDSLFNMHCRVFVGVSRQEDLSVIDDFWSILDELTPCCPSFAGIPIVDVVGVLAPGRDGADLGEILLRKEAI
ncbi:hypothetical protein BJX96DRAFT_162390 [Aspergillus floccosus]